MATGIKKKCLNSAAKTPGFLVYRWNRSKDSVKFHTMDPTAIFRSQFRDSSQFGGYIYKLKDWSLRERSSYTICFSTSCTATNPRYPLMDKESSSRSSMQAFQKHANSEAKICESFHSFLCQRRCIWNPAKIVNILPSWLLMNEALSNAGPTIDSGIGSFPKSFA